MKRIILGMSVLATCALTARPAIAILAEQEPNNSLQGAQSLEGSFELSTDSSIQDAGTIPHVSIQGSGDGTDDFFSFIVSQAGKKGIFDIDGTNIGDDLFLALALFNDQGVPIVLASNDDTAILDPGSTNPLDPFLTATFPNVGQYFLVVTRGSPNIGQGILPGTVYRLNLSVEGHSVDLPPGGGGGGGGAIPEPASAALALMSLAALGGTLRRRR